MCIISKLGTPTIDELDAMNKDYTKYRLPELPATPFTTLFHHVRSTPNFTEAIDLLSQLFVYIPQRRILPLAACAHPYFDELRDPAKKLPGGRDLPPLLNFTESELAGAGPELRAKLTAQSPPVVPLVKPSNTPFAHE